MRSPSCKTPRAGRIGNVLTGDDYADWLQTADTLASGQYMKTEGTDKPPAERGTKYWNLATGMQQYAQDRGAKIYFDGMYVDPQRATARKMPDWVKLQDKGPTIDQLYNMLAGGAGVVMGMNNSRDGHIVTLAGMDWDDINGDGIVDPGEATLSIIDPLDPSSHYGNPEPEPYGADGLQPQQAVLTTLAVWQTTAPDPKTGEPVSVLKIEYWQYQGSHDPNQPNEPYTPYNRSYGPTGLYISGAFSMTAVPEPTSVLVWSSLVLGFTLTRRRRMA